MACGNKSEGLAQEVHRRHPPLGGGGQERRVDRQRPRNKPFVGAIVPLAQRHLPPWRSARRCTTRRTTLPTKGCSSQKVQASGSTPKSGTIPAGRSAGTASRGSSCASHRPGWCWSAAEAPEAPRARLVRYNPVGQGRPTRRCVLGSSPGCRAKSGLVAEAARAKATRGTGSPRAASPPSRQVQQRADQPMAAVRRGTGDG